MPNHLKNLLDDPIEFNLAKEEVFSFSNLPLMTAQTVDLVSDNLFDERDNYSDFSTWEFDNE